MEPEQQRRVRLIATETRDPATAFEIVESSHEGVPAHPEIGPVFIWLMLGFAFVLLVAMSVVAAFVLSPIIGLIAIVLGLLCLCANPAIWATVMRARERQRVRRAQDRGNNHGYTDPTLPRVIRSIPAGPGH